MLAITLRAPPRERSRKYSKILSRSAKASGVYRSLIDRGVCPLLPRLHQIQILPGRLVPAPCVPRYAPHRSYCTRRYVALVSRASTPPALPDPVPARFQHAPAGLLASWSWPYYTTKLFYDINPTPASGAEPCPPP